MASRRIMLRTIRGKIFFLSGYAYTSNEKRKKVLVAESPYSHSRDARKVAASVATNHYGDFMEIPHGFPVINHIPSIAFGPAQEFAKAKRNSPLPEVAEGQARLFPLESLPACISALFHPQHEPYVLVINHPTVPPENPA